VNERIFTSLSALGIALAPALMKFAESDAPATAATAEAAEMCVGPEEATVHDRFEGTQVDARLPPGAIVQVLGAKKTWRRVAYVTRSRAEVGWVAASELTDCGARTAALTSPPEGDALPTSGSALAASSSAPLTIFSVDIGQGDASVVLGPRVQGTRRAMVIDAGDLKTRGGRTVRALLVEQGVQSLDYVVLSHFDADHLGGFVTIQGSPSLLWNSPSCEPSPFFPTQNIFDQGTDTNDSKSSNQWRECVPKIANQLGTRYAKVEGGQEIGTVLDLGGGARATIVAGGGFVLNRPDVVPNADSANERSIAVLVSNNQGFDMLITGDLIGQKSGEEDAKVEPALGQALLAAGVDVEILRTGHHGAANATEASFVKAIRPEVAIISVGDQQGSNFKHPRCTTYQSLHDGNVGLVLQTELGRTDCENDPPVEPVVVNGTIKIEVTGNRYTIQSHGTESPTNGLPTNDVAFTCSAAQGCSAGGSAPTGGGGTPCCKTCTNSKPCGNACIPQGSTCNQPPGCACAAN